jgi:hypothetical protein
MARRHSSRRVRIHRNYTLAGAATLLGVHKHTVSRWIAAGLPTTDDERPLLVNGEDLRAFLKARESQKQPCRANEFYCLRCRVPRRPACDMADYTPETATRGLLRGICPICNGLIYRAASLRTIKQTAGGLDVAFQPAKRRIDDSSPPLSKVDFKRDKRT